MKSPSLILVSIAIGLLSLTACTTAPVALPACPAVLQYGGKAHLASKVPFEQLKVGDTVLYRAEGYAGEMSGQGPGFAGSAPGMALGTIAADRHGAFVLEGGSFTLLTVNNYIGKILL